MFRLIRHSENPILEPRPDLSWEREGVFNPGIAKVGNEIKMLYRAVGERDSYISHIGLATSADGVHFRRFAKGASQDAPSSDSSLASLLTSVLPSPVFGPSTAYDKWATEDCRVTPIGDEFYVTYVAVPDRIMDHDKGIDRALPLETSTALMRTQNFLDFEHMGIISPKHSDNKDIVIFPKKIPAPGRSADGESAPVEKYAMLHRPNRWSKDWFAGAYAKAVDVPLPENLDHDALPTLPSIWISWSDDLITWTDHRLLLSPSHVADAKIGPGLPPIETHAGWLVIYHHVDRSEHPITKAELFRYSVRAALLDLSDPSRIIGKLPYDILEPEMPYETEKGTHIVFPTGGFVSEGILHVYYGASDLSIGLATGRLDELLAELNEAGIGGKTHHETA